MKRGSVTGASRRGTEMSLNVIIMIVIGLIVAGIIIYLVSTNSHRANDDFGACEAKGGHCWSGGPCPEGETGNTFFTKGCPGENDICCKESSW